VFHLRVYERATFISRVSSENPPFLEMVAFEHSKQFTSDWRYMLFNICATPEQTTFGRRVRLQRQTPPRLWVGEAWQIFILCQFTCTQAEEIFFNIQFESKKMLPMDKKFYLLLVTRFIIKTHTCNISSREWREQFWF
jgi:hypothetical protein